MAHAFDRIAVHAGTPLPAAPRLAVNAPGDVYEHDADRTAERVMANEADSPRALSAGPAAASSGRLHPFRAAPAAAGPATAPPVVHAALRTPGYPLDAAARRFMEPRFGRGLGGVRVHTGPVAEQSARAVRALAYTVGSDVVFGAGQYQPHTAPGQRLLAHELAHVFQPQPAGGSLRRFHIPHPAATGHTADETALIAGTFADMLATIKAIITASSTGDQVNMDAFVLNAGGQPVTREVDRKLGTHSTATAKSMLRPRYLFTARCGLVDMRHFIQLLYISNFFSSAFPGSDGNRAATGKGRKHELDAEPESRFGPEDTATNALGAFTGAGLAMLPRPDDLFASISDTLTRCGPVDYATLSPASKDAIRHFYGDVVTDPASKTGNDFIPKNQNESAVPAVFDLPELAGRDRSFPYALDTSDPHRKTISGTAFGGGAAGLASDSDIREFVSVQRPEVIRAIPATEKVRLVTRLLKGYVHNSDLDALEVIYRNATPAEQAQIRAAINPADLTFEDQRNRLKGILGP
ncbi:MAG TPA: DUF4157 domain-containing protein [Longimicrobium sp.]|nr:DUF4157 domain-containing protein [Longimicrobium sp.]